ncbi:MAG: glycosyltransferase family 4 protein, partial [Balneolaceae bacterium]
ISQYYPPEVGAGAVRAEAMVRVLSELGFDVDVLSEVPNYPVGKVYPGYDPVWKRVEQTSTGSVTRLWVKINQRSTIVEQMLFFSSFMVSSFIHLISDSKPYDIIFVSSPPIFVSITAAIISKIKGTKFVIEVRDLWPDSAVKDNLFAHKSWFMRFGRFIERWLYRTADKVIAVTQESAQVIEQKSGKKNTAVVYNGVDTELFRSYSDSELTIPDKKEKGKFRVGYVGSLGLIHDLHTLIRAAKLCESDPEIEFMIVGDGVKRDEMLSYVDDLKPKNVTWVGMKSHREIPQYISTFDVAVNPINKSEAFKSIVTVKFYEYLACEVPVISLAEGAQQTISDNSRAGINCDIGDHTALAETIKELFKNPKKRNSLASNARPFVEKEYSRTNQATILADTLKTLRKGL